MQRNTEVPEEVAKRPQPRAFTLADARKPKNAYQEVIDRVSRNNPHTTRSHRHSDGMPESR